MIKTIVRNFYHNTKIGFLLIHPLIRLKDFYLFNILPEKKLLENRFEKMFGRKMNWNNPETLNEKIIWLKIHDRSDLHTQCADKIAVHDYVREMVGEDYLIPMYFTTANPNEIIPENLPDFPVIIKTNHDSGGGIFVSDKSEVNWEDVQESLAKRLKKNYYNRTKEWQYKNIVPKILVEKLLISPDGNPPNDLKFHCFNGKVRMVQVDIARGTPNHCRNWYDSDWNREPYRWSSPKGKGKFTDPSDEDVPKPAKLKEMKQVCEKLASRFDYVRVDLYDHNDRIYFGELTFHHDGGNQPILPEKWDYALGQELEIKITRNNDVQ